MDNSVGTANANTAGCVDHSTKCSFWASRGECFANPGWMMRNCRHSCQACQGGKSSMPTLAYHNALNCLRRKRVGIANVFTLLKDEQEQTMKIFGTLLMVWNDSRVEWDRKEWGISWLNLVWSQIWTPRLVSIKAPPTRLPSDFSNKAVALHYSGQVYAWTDFNLYTFAAMDYSRFPYDQQTGCFRLGDHRDFTLQFDVAPQAKEMMQKSLEKLRPPGWNVKSSDIYVEKQTQQMIAMDTDATVDVAASVLDICVSLRRDTAYAALIYLAPSFATALITVVSLLVHRQWNKIVLLVTSLALQLLFINSLESKLPPASGKTPLFGKPLAIHRASLLHIFKLTVKFCSCNMAVTSLVLLLELFLCSMESVRTAIPPPRWIMLPANRFCHMLPTLLAPPETANKLTEDARVDNIVDLSSPSTSGNLWMPVIRTARFFAFASVVIFYVLLFMATFAF
ncbi:ShK and Neur chan LBD domain containing protein [Trichuris trichiura]|uniref:ShK and Neur chan LBD domain containing protein n=1 Tax=Trichuris trichiura TaxID=36087 RepID=A0A077YXG6_TRITR|nr:ShK and Neur chan LBD domain containing protein [Trichuris trichiura]